MFFNGENRHNHTLFSTASISKKVLATLAAVTLSFGFAASSVSLASAAEHDSPSASSEASPSAIETNALVTTSKRAAKAEADDASSAPSADSAPSAPSGDDGDSVKQGDSSSAPSAPAPDDNRSKSPEAQSAQSETDDPSGVPSAAPSATPKALAAAVTPTVKLTCGVGDFYTVTRGGVIAKISVNSSGVPSAAVSSLPLGNTQNGWTNLNSEDSVNGLAITENGETAYAFSRYSSGDNSRVQILKYTDSTGVYSTVTLSGGASYYQLPADKGDSGNMIAGAINPSDNKYYFGGYDNSTGANFYLYVFDPANNSVTYKGYIVPKDRTQTGNGDIGFDSAGNLSLIYSQGTYNQIVPVTKSALDAASGGLIASAAAQPTIANSTGANMQYNGIAFGADGSILVQAGDNNGSDTRVLTVDPNTWAMTPANGVLLSGMPGTGNSRLGVDLASCIYPPTLVAQKNVVARGLGTDQFNMEVKRAGNTTVFATATTTGNSNGIQSEKAGPIVASSGAKYVITESGVGTTNPAAYNTTWKCEADSTVT